MGPILVFGHRNPDNDSICSAVAYAHLKNLTDAENVYVPARLGPVPRETAWVFERFGVELPEEIATCARACATSMTPDVTVGANEQPMLEAGRLMREHGVRALPVVDGEGGAVGLVSQRMLAERYLDETEIVGFQRMPVTVGQLARVLDGDALAGDPAASIQGTCSSAPPSPRRMPRASRPATCSSSAIACARSRWRSRPARRA